MTPQQQHITTAVFNYTHYRTVVPCCLYKVGKEQNSAELVHSKKKKKLLHNHIFPQIQF